MNATCRADEEDFYTLSQELLQVINFTEINKVVCNLFHKYKKFYIACMNACIYITLMIMLYSCVYILIYRLMI